MKLHAPNRQFLVPHTHDFALITLGGDFETIGQRVALDDERMWDTKTIGRCRQKNKDAGPSVSSRQIHGSLRTREGYRHGCSHETAIEAGGLTIAVIGTALSRAYPAENQPLQKRIAEDYLLISQVPMIRCRPSGPKQNRIFFPRA